MGFKWNNIGFKEIKEILENKESIFKNNSLNIELIKEDKFYGEVDQLFISYLLLFLESNSNLKISLNFTDVVESSKFFKFAQQINQSLELYSKYIPVNNFSISGSYVTKDGEIKDVSEYKLITQSSSFIPPLLIYKSNRNPTNNSIGSFFENKADTESIITKKYREHLTEFVSGRLKLEKTKQKVFYDKFINEIQDFSFIKICLLYIIVENSTFEVKGNEDNIRIFNNLITFCDDLIEGLKELAKNIIEHSGSSGVITIRKFSNEVLENLKSQANLSEYLKLYENEKNFLDINVIDLGKTDIKNKYIENIRNVKKLFQKKIKENLSNTTSSLVKQNEEEILSSLNINFDNDIKIIEEKDFSFHNLYINDGMKGVNELSIQRNKFITKIGLQYFTSIVKDNYNGFIQVSSVDEKTVLYNDTNKNTITKVIEDNSFMLFGTFYSCYIPIKVTREKLKKELSNEKQGIRQDENTFTELSKYNYIDKSAPILDRYKKDKKNIIDYRFVPASTNNFSSTEDHKYSKYIDLYLELSSNLKAKINDQSKENDIIVVSCKEIQKEKITNGSEWIRFIWTLTNFFNNIVLYDIDLKHFISVIHIRNQFFQNGAMDFWEEDSSVLFYSKKKSDDIKYYRYGVNILAGKNVDEFAYLNNRIWNHHYSFKIDKLGVFYDSEKTFPDSKHLKTPLFTDKGNLHYYEVLLCTQTENEDSISLFEKSVQYSLNTLLEKKKNDETNNRGYKIENTHFRLGSKIHISDFYYAKKLFQNSFFTTPLAYKMAKNIIDENKKLFDDKEICFTLVGYESYSSFLISSIRSFLYKLNPDKEISINHLTIDKDGNVSIEPKRVKEKVLIVVPIASTFNTSLKIEDQLNKLFNEIQLNRESGKPKKVEVIQPSQNAIWVAHRPKDKKIFEGYFDEEGNLISNDDNIYKKYGWTKTSKNKKTITLERYNSYNEVVKEREQKYSVPVYTQWQEAKTCKICYPEDAYNEKCLIETGKASITPQVIFDYPKTKKEIKTEGFDYNILSLEGSLLFGNLKKNNNKYLYFTRTGKLVEDNEVLIKGWIEKLEKVLSSDFKDKKIVIVTPNTGSKSKFLDLINEHLFHYTANCIIISLREDYIENAETLYTDGLHNADVVVYIDDVLSTIKSFLEVNFIVNYIRNKNQTGKGIDYCIALVNRMSYENENNLTLELKGLNRRDKLFYFQKINHTNIEEANNEFPLSLEYEKYDSLEKNSSLDQIRKYFHQKKRNISQVDLNKKLIEDIKDYSLDFSRERRKRNKKLYQYLVSDALYQIFLFEKEEKEKEYKDRRTENLNQFFPPLNSNFYENEEAGITSLEKLKERIKDTLSRDFQHQHIILENNKNLDSVIIKVICSTPLIYYKQIRVNALNWILIKLKSLVEKIEKLDNIKDFYKINTDSDYNYYQDLKFLLKKSVKLRSNFIIHPNTFEFFESLLGKIKSLDISILRSSNTTFKNEFEKLLTNEQYLNSPYIKLKLYDFVQNNLKDDVFDEINFGEYLIKKEGVFEDLENQKEPERIKLNLEVDYHKNIIKTYFKYRDEKIKASRNHTKPLSEIDKPSEIKYEIAQEKDKALIESFNSNFKLLLNEYPRYRVSSGKNLIVNIVAFVQELTFDHEVKSFKLDDVIDRKDTEQDNSNGTYNHLIRLLKLENIEVLNKYSGELLKQYKTEIEEKKTTTHKGEKLDISYIEKETINQILIKDKKYQDLCELQKEFHYNTSSLDSFLALRKYLVDSINKDGKDDKIEVKINIIAKYIKEIIDTSHGDIVEDVFISINYKEFKKFQKDNVYTFALKPYSNRIGLLSQSKSLTESMGNGGFKTTDNHLFSHIEIIKKENDLICREDDNVKELIKATEQYEQLENGKSILLIRLSNFKNSDNQGDELHSRGVITIYLNHSERLSVKTLRLLLALRQDLLKFIKKKTLGSTFLELLQLERKDTYFNNLKHDFEHFFTILSSIKNDFYNQIKSKSEKTEKDNKQFDIINETLQLQTFGFSNNNILLSEKYTIDEIKKYISTILSSIHITNEEMPVTAKNIVANHNKKDFNIPKILIGTVLLHFLINLKKYTEKITDNYSITINATNNSLEIVLVNKINYYAIDNNRNGKGNKMSKEIVETLNNHPDLYKLNIKKIELEYDKTPNVNEENVEEYKVKIKINYDEKSM